METRTQGDPGRFSTQGCHRRFAIGPGTLGARRGAPLQSLARKRPNPSPTSDHGFA
jgi:hypothetical protein